MQRTPAGIGALGSWLVAIVLLASGCRQSASGTVKKMQTLACAGNASGFMSYFDRDMFVANSVAQAERTARKLVADNDTPLQREGFQEYLKTEPQKTAALVATSFSEWEIDIKRGRDGNFCRMTVQDATELGDDADVHVRTPSGREKVWRLARKGKEWRLVDMFGGGNIPPLGLPAVASSDLFPVDRASVDALLERVARAMRLFASSTGGGTVEATIARYEMAVDDLHVASRQLFPHAPTGVPDDLAREVSGKLEAVASANQAAMNCLRQSGARGHRCDELNKEIYDSSVELGKAITGLAAYGSKPITEAMKEFTERTRSTVDSKE